LNCCYLQEAIYKEEGFLWRIIFDDVFSKFFISGKEVTKETFLSTMMEKKPLHFFWLLWHSEVLIGRFDYGLG